MGSAIATRPTYSHGTWAKMGLYLGPTAVIVVAMVVLAAMSQYAVSTAAPYLLGVILLDLDG